MYDKAGFETCADLTTAADGAPLAEGLWDISLAIGAQGLTTEVRIGSKRAGDVSGKARTQVVAAGEELRAVTLYTTEPHGNFTLDLGEHKYDAARTRGGGSLTLVSAGCWRSAPTEPGGREARTVYLTV
ncbi:hypothetical protein [Streptomyces sp. HUAS ZL42]|uniref:hypothetical protein n=1 Tax=Streptomyces sp. HUAS ZL42 TaxID=3231715 RepID=UPI00345E69C5